MEPSNTHANPIISVDYDSLLYDYLLFDQNPSWWYIPEIKTSCISCLQNKKNNLSAHTSTYLKRDQVSLKNKFIDYNSLLNLFFLELKKGISINQKNIYLQISRNKIIKQIATLLNSLLTSCR